MTLEYALSRERSPITPPDAAPRPAPGCDVAAESTASAASGCTLRPRPARRSGMATSRDPWTIVLGVAALGNLANGAWMLADPVHWYENLPAGVPDFGPVNEHFVRDIGCAFMVLGLAL